jgi:hypothetical protein
MSTAVQRLLDAFDRLTEDEQREAASEILMRTLRFDDPPLEDEMLNRIAHEIFLELDARQDAES